MARACLQTCERRRDHGQAGGLEEETGACAIFVNCRTKLIATCRDLYPDAFAFEGSRALLVQAGAPLPVNAISHCTSLAFRYHAKIGAPRAQRP